MNAVFALEEDKIYKGVTGRNAFSRGLEQQQGLRQKSEQSALWKLCVLEPVACSL